MKRAVKVDINGLPVECPRCDSDNLCIDNVEGMECMKCGCWFDTLDSSGTIIWARDARPMDVDFL